MHAEDVGWPLKSSDNNTSANTTARGSKVVGSIGASFEAPVSYELAAAA